MDAQLPDGQNIVLLQGRPETVWSRKPAHLTPERRAKDTFRSIVATLLDGAPGPRPNELHGHTHG